MKKFLTGKMYKTKDIAHDLEVVRGTVINWIKKKKIPAQRVGNQWRIAGEDLNKFMEWKNE